MNNSKGQSSELNIRMVPSNEEMEQAVLGALLLDPLAIHTVSPILHPKDFYLERYGWIYEAILVLQQRHDPIDFLTVSAELEKRQRLKEIGGITALAELARSVPTALHIATYAEKVVELSLSRQLMVAGTHIVEIGYDASISTDQKIVKATGALAKVRAVRRSKFRSSREIGEEMEPRLQEQFRNPKKVWGLPTGIGDLDERLGGLEKKNLIIVGGAPGMGKSALGLQIAGNVAAQGKRVAYFSLEMGEQEHQLRLVCQRHGYNSKEVRRGMLLDPSGRFREWSAEEQEKFLQNWQEIKALPIFFNDAASITTMEAASAAAELMLVEDVELIIFDYLQLAQAKGDNRVQQVGQISHGLKEIAKSLSLPVVALAQLSRATATSEDKRPQLWHLRESGDIEADADVVLFIYRAAYYYKEEQWKFKFKTQPYPANTAEILISKNRTGDTGFIELLWDASHTRYLPIQKEKETRNQRFEEGLGGFEERELL